MRRLCAWLCILGVVLFIVIATFAGTVAASVLISPARLEAVVGPDGATPGIVVVNRGSQVVTVRFSLVGGGHDLYGMPVFNENDTVQAFYAEQIHISPQECVLAPGEGAHVNLTVKRKSATGLYPALIADIIPAAMPSGGVRALTRIAVPVLLTFAPLRDTTEKVQVMATDITVAQDEPGGAVQIETMLHNRGSMHVRAGGKLQVVGPHATAEVPFPPVTILPGLARQVRTAWVPEQLPAGNYLVRLAPDSSWVEAEGSTVASFQVIRPYEVARVDLELEQLLVSDTVPGVLNMRALVANHGNVAAYARVSIQVAQGDGLVVATADFPVEVEPGGGRLLEQDCDIRGVEPGSYTVQAQVWQGERQLLAVEQPIRISALHLAAR